MKLEPILKLSLIGIETSNKEQTPKLEMVYMNCQVGWANRKAQFNIKSVELADIKSRC